MTSVLDKLTLAAAAPGAAGRNDDFIAISDASRQAVGALVVDEEAISWAQLTMLVDQFL